MSFHHPHPWKGMRPWQRHSLVLMVCGIVFILIGFSYITAEPTKTRRTALHYALLWAPIEFWGSLFILAGVLAIISSRWPPISETWGYTVLTGLSAGWSCIYLMGVVFGHAPLSNLSAVFSWGVIAFLWWAISGLVNPGVVVITHRE